MLFLPLLLFLVIASNAIFYPTFKQCDPRWGKDIMRTVTICSQGCAMTCISSALNGHGFIIGNKSITPSTLNSWINAHNGYICEAGDCNNLNLTLIPQISSSGNILYQGENPKPSSLKLQNLLSDSSNTLIAHVRNKSHFVLLDGTYFSTNNSFGVMDPFYDVNSYTYEGISDIIHYVMTLE